MVEESKSPLAKVLAVLPGLVVMAGTLYVLKDIVVPWLKPMEVFGIKQFFDRVLSLNYILLSIIMGVIYRNVIFGGKIPALFEPGFRMTRLFIKSGVIMLGSLYTFMKLLEVGGIAIALIFAFVFGTIFLVFFLGKKFGMDRSMIGVMGAACGVCGVSAAVATSPAVRAKPSEVALAIATIMGFGVVTMIISPYIGKALGLSDFQYGAWVGTGILNSGQVLATCLTFNPTIAQGTALFYGEIFNVVRVLTIPFVVFLITVWYYKNAEPEEGENAAVRPSLLQILKAKFPVFVLGFLAMTLLNTFGMLGKEGSVTIHELRESMQWIFGIGLIGQGAYIDIREIKTAGGKPLKVGLMAGFIKWTVALILVYLFMPAESTL